MGAVRTLFALFYLCILLHSQLTWAQNRTARPMSEDFFNSILFTVVGSNENRSAFGDGDENPSNSTLDDSWEAQTEWNWQYAAELATNESKWFPFIVCSDENIPSLERREKIVKDGIGLGIVTTLDDYIETIYTTSNITCVTALVDGIRAETLGQFIVQPIGFIMKLNAGTLDFVADQDKAREFAINFCPGLPWLDLPTFALDAVQRILPAIDFLLTVPQIEPFAPDLMALQEELAENPSYCDDALLDNVEADQAGTDYVILTLTSSGDGSAPEACFLLFALGLAHAPEICFIERREPYSGENVVANWIGQSGVKHETPFTNAGITGKGQIVAVSDSGVDLKSCYFRDAESLGPFAFGERVDKSRRKVIQYVDFVDDSDYELGHGTHVCGTIAGRKSEDGVNETTGMADGIAFDAKLAVFDVGITVKRFRVPGARSLLEPGRVAGALIHSASWGSESTYYTAQDRDFDRYIHDDDSFLVIVAAGNKGPAPETVGSPANAKNVLTVGASSSAEGDLKDGVTPVDVLAGFSSTGPAMDGRIKPDIVAPGYYILSAGARPYAACDPASEADLPGPGEGGVAGVLSLQGTSMATPVVSGFAALTRQYFSEGWHGNGSKASAPGMTISGTLLKAVLINGAQPLEGYDFDAVDTKQGFGRISLIDSLPLLDENDLSGEFIDNETVSQGGVNQYEVTLDSGSKTCSDPDLSVTLVWPDPPGYVSCLQCILNDLDLQVVRTDVADGARTIHYPNGRHGKDSINTVERVRLKVSPGDSIRITVTAAQLESLEQKYAITWVYGCLNNRARAMANSSSGTTTLSGIVVVFVATVAMSLLVGEFCSSSTHAKADCE